MREGIETQYGSLLTGVVPDDFAKKYLRLIHPKQLAKLERSFDSKLRWQDHDHDTYWKNETVLDHVVSLLESVNNIELRRYPSLAQALDRDALRLMIILHDIGEIRTGDLPMTSDKSQRVLNRRAQLKAKEHAAGRDIIAQLELEDDALHSALAILYERVLSRRTHPRDLEVHMLKFIELTQSVTFGEKYVFPARREKGEGYEKRGTHADPEYISEICDAVVDSLVDKPNKRNALDDFWQFANETLLKELDEFYPGTGVIRENLKMKISKVYLESVSPAK
jgi:5'-deoxynucleotidase YfbR-like HD superfamily hydrolase